MDAKIKKLPKILSLKDCKEYHGAFLKLKHWTAGKGSRGYEVV